VDELHAAQWHDCELCDTGTLTMEHRRLRYCCVAVATIPWLATCGREPLSRVQAGVQVAATCPDVALADAHYPDWTAGPWGLPYTEFLQKANVGPLWCGNGDDAYRFVLVPDYRPAIVAELRRQEGKWTAVTLAYEDPRTTPYEQRQPWRLTSKSERTVAAAEIVAFAESLERAEFWSAPSMKTQSGAVAEPWVIEAREGSSYRAIARSGGVDESLREVARAMVRLSGAPLPERMRP
jgi:hypothetical protein